MGLPQPPPGNRGLKQLRGRHRSPQRMTTASGAPESKAHAGARQPHRIPPFPAERSCVVPGALRAEFQAPTTRVPSAVSEPRPARSQGARSRKRRPRRRPAAYSPRSRSISTKPEKWTPNTGAFAESRRRKRTTTYLPGHPLGRARFAHGCIARCSTRQSPPQRGGNSASRGTSRYPKWPRRCRPIANVRHPSFGPNISGVSKVGHHGAALAKRQSRTPRGQPRQRF